MSNELKDLSISYPFMPVAVQPAFFRNVKYMRIVVILPAGQPVNLAKNGDYIVAMLTGFDATTAHVRVTCSAYGYSENYNVPIVWSGIPTGNNWMYVEGDIEWPQDAPEAGYRIHPSCLVFQQMAPILKIEKSDSGLPPVIIQQDDDDTISPYMLDTDMFQWDDILELENGHNVEVSGSSDSIVFTAAAGIGKGVFPVKFYTQADNLAGKRGVGMHSINGRTGDVLIHGDRSVEVDTVGNTVTITAVNQD